MPLAAQEIDSLQLLFWDNLSPLGSSGRQQILKATTQAVYSRHLRITTTAGLASLRWPPVLFPEAIHVAPPATVQTQRL